jgi:hypothetical protein
MKGLLGREGQVTVLRGACFWRMEERVELKSRRYDSRETGVVVYREEERMSLQKLGIFMERKQRVVLVMR